jgi:hypothetical protein
MGHQESVDQILLPDRPVAGVRDEQVTLDLGSEETGILPVAAPVRTS